MVNEFIMTEVSEGENKFLLELKNALRKLNKSHEEDGLDKAEGMNSSGTSDTLTPGDTTCTYSLNDATMSSTLTLNGDVTTDAEKLANDKTANLVRNPEPKATVNECDHKSVPYVALYDSKITQEGLVETKHLQQNGRLPGIHVSNNNNKSVPSGLKVQVSDVETPEGSNASSPKTMSTVYNSDKELTIQRQISDPKTPSPAPWPISETESPHTNQRPRNMKMAQADLYNELNSVLKKRNQMTRRSSILELERQKGCRTIVYYGRGGASCGQLNRKGSVTNSSPSPLVASRMRPESVASKTDSLASDCVMPAVESPLPPSGNTRLRNKKVIPNSYDSVVVNKSNSKFKGDESHPKSKITQDHRGKPELPWVPPPTIGPDGGKSIALDLNSTSQIKDTNSESCSQGQLLHPQNMVSTATWNFVNQASGPSKLLTYLTQSQFCTEEHSANSDSSEADSVVSKELIDLRKTFDTVDSNNIAPRSPPVPSSDELKERNNNSNNDQIVNSSETKITVEIQWPKFPPPSYLHDKLRKWHERLSGKWKNQDEDDILEDRVIYYSDDEEETESRVDRKTIPDRDNPSGASESSIESAHTPITRLQLPRAALSPSTRQRLRDIKQTAAAKLFPKAEDHNDVKPGVSESKTIEKHNHEFDNVAQKQLRATDTEEEEKESSIDFTEEVHPGNLVSQLVDRVRADNVDTHTARVQCDDVMAGQVSDTTSELSAHGSLLSQSEYRGDIDQTRTSNTPGHIENIPAVTSDMSLTSVTSYDVSSGDLPSETFQCLGQSSNETLAFSSGADVRYTSCSSINQNSKSWDRMIPQDSQNSIPSVKPPSHFERSKLSSTLEETESVVQAYAGSSTLEGQKQFTQSKKSVFVKVIPTTFSRQPSRGFADEKVRSLDRVLVRKCKHTVQYISTVEIDNCGHNSHEGNGYTNYATYPPSSRPYTPPDDGDETLTNLMITHSGDPLPPPGRTSMDEAGQSAVDNRHNCISANVTVPQPTSFHTHGNNVGGHLINPHDMVQKGGIYVDSDGFQVSSSCTDYESGVDNPGNISDSCSRLLQTGNDSESGEESRHHFQKKHVTVLDKESQRHLLFQTWSSNAAAKKARDRSRLPHWRKGSKSVHQADDSDSSVGHRLSAYDRGGRQHHSDHKLNDSRCNSRSMVKSRLLRHADSFSSCDAPCGEMGVYHQKSDRTFTGAESIHSACTYVADSQEHSSDGDTESLYQDYEQYEQSLIQYVRTEDLSQINEDIRSLYWQQFDSMSLTGLPGHHKGIFHRLVCCFFCEHNHGPRFPDRGTSRASSSKIFSRYINFHKRVQLNCLVKSTKKKPKPFRR